MNSKFPGGIGELGLVVIPPRACVCAICEKLRDNGGKAWASHSAQTADGSLPPTGCFAKAASASSRSRPIFRVDQLAGIPII